MVLAGSCLVWENENPWVTIYHTFHDDRLSHLTQFTSVTDRRTDERTDRHPDVGKGRTSIASCGKNQRKNYFHTLPV